jgi:hypothetical protein
MILDWNRFRQILETTENKRLISIIDHVDFLNDFLIQLSQVRKVHLITSLKQII